MQLSRQHIKPTPLPVRQIIFFLSLPAEPYRRRRLTEREVIECEHLFLEFLIVSLDTSIGIGKGKKFIAAPLCCLLVFSLKEFIHDIAFEQTYFLLTCQTKCRRNVGRVDMRLQKSLAE